MAPEGGRGAEGTQGRTRPVAWRGPGRGERAPGHVTRRRVGGSAAEGRARGPAGPLGTWGGRRGGWGAGPRGPPRVCSLLAAGAPHVAGKRLDGPATLGGRCPALLGPAPASCLPGGRRGDPEWLRGDGGVPPRPCPSPPAPPRQEGGRPASFLLPRFSQAQASPVAPPLPRVCSLMLCQGGKLFFGWWFLQEGRFAWRGVSCRCIHLVLVKRFPILLASVSLLAPQRLLLLIYVGCSSAWWRLTKSNSLPSDTDVGLRKRRDVVVDLEWY